MTRVSLLMGMEFNGQLRLENASGDVIGEADYEPVAVLGLTLRSRF